MNITHICLYGPVTDGWNYQENMLTKYQKKMGNEVTIITSKWVWNKSNALVRLDKSDYFNEDGVKVIRLDMKGKGTILSKFKRYIDVYSSIENTQPDILFIHNAAFLDIGEIVDFLKKHPNVRTYVDNHNDFSNSGRNWISKNLLHKGIWRWTYKKIIPYTEKFYGVLPARVDFLVDLYGTPKEKTELLVMGADDEQIERVQKEHAREKIREKYGISDKDFLIVTGGKIDQFKTQTILLMKAISNMNCPNVKLIVFGAIAEELKESTLKLCNGKTIQYIGWINANQSYDYFSAADLVAFPGRHSVFWEQVAGMGIPMICKYWDGTTHVDVGGNVLFLKNDSEVEMEDVISNIVNNRSIYESMKKIAQTGMNKFRYKDIARIAISE